MLPVASRVLDYYGPRILVQMDKGQAGGMTRQAAYVRYEEARNAHESVKGRRCMHRKRNRHFAVVVSYKRYYYYYYYSYT